MSTEKNVVEVFDTDKKKKIIIISAISLGSLAIIAGAVFAWLALRPVKVPDPQKDPDAARKLLASKDFNKLTPKQQNDFVRSFRPTRRPSRAEMESARKAMQSMSPEQRRTMMENTRKVFMRQQEERLDRFFKLSKKEQIAELDRRIAEQDKRRAEFQRRRAQRSRNQNQSDNNNQQSQVKKDQQPNQQNPQNAQSQNNNNNHRRRPSAQMRREFESNMSPSLHSKMQQYRQMERLRRQKKLK